MVDLASKHKLQFKRLQTQHAKAIEKKEKALDKVKTALAKEATKAEDALKSEMGVKAERDALTEENTRLKNEINALRGLVATDHSPVSKKAKTKHSSGSPQSIISPHPFHQHLSPHNAGSQFPPTGHHWTPPYGFSPYQPLTIPITVPVTVNNNSYKGDE